MHIDYSKREPQWKRVRDAIDGQDAVHAAKEVYLPKTSGMVKNDRNEQQYNAYRLRARFYEITQGAESGILGLAFNKEPEIDLPIDPESVTIDGKDVIELSRCQMREALETGRGIMVVDAPVDGGDPYITEYKCEALVDWGVDDRDKSKLIAAKFEEEYFKPEDVYKTNPEKRTREYLLIDGKATIRILDEIGKQAEEDITLPLDYLPIFFAGSVDTSPDIDPIPLLPIANTAVKVYQLSADYFFGIHMENNGTFFVSGIDEDQWIKLKEQGAGAGALWWLGDDGKAGIIETSGNGAESTRTAIQDELILAQGYAVAMTEKGGIESAEALRIRAASRHATIFTVMASVSEAIVQAVECMAEWGGNAGEATFNLNADFTQLAASEQMLNSINAAIGAGNIPQDVMFSYIREVGLTTMTDDELRGAIMDSGTALQI